MARGNHLERESHFAFGKNWLDYAEKIDEEKIVQATVDLQRLSGDGLQEKTFLDIGCGSGLHALAALRLGAKRVIGTDIDPDSVATARSVLTRFAPGAPVEFEVCSVFDATPDRFGTFDVVYSWGVLHHTGDMNRAITVAANLVAPNGEFLVALYKKTLFCRLWQGIKRRYSRTTPERQRRVMNFYISLYRIGIRMSGRDFKAYVASYGKNRGMDFYNDVHDWLGGYPYESISPRACHALFDSLGFRLEREFLTKLPFPPGLVGSGCDAYAFRRA